MLYQLWSILYTHLLRGCYKWLLNQYTGQCELQRICLNILPGGQRTIKVENSLTSSKSSILHSAMEVEKMSVEKAVEDIMECKKIYPSTNTKFRELLLACLLQITGYRQLLKDVEAKRKQAYDSHNLANEEILFQLWSLLMPTVPLSARISKQWGDVGFQGNDPQTDFRGMGMFGLLNLQYFASQHQNVARSVLSHSHHPQYGFSFAIVGIDLTEMVYTFLRKGTLKCHMYNVAPATPSLRDIHEVFCILFSDFDKFWRQAKPRDIMEFSAIREKFRVHVEKCLENPGQALVMHNTVTQFES
uniref:ELMO/CED-12 domain containing 2 n=1 Tax=Eptatretus burgeri TaxID=7764 RepID=A0A8C4WYG2_EPTBU